MDKNFKDINIINEGEILIGIFENNDKLSVSFDYGNEWFDFHYDENGLEKRDIEVEYFEILKRNIFEDILLNFMYFNKNEEKFIFGNINFENIFSISFFDRK